MRRAASSSSGQPWMNSLRRSLDITRWRIFSGSSARSGQDAAFVLEDGDRAPGDLHRLRDVLRPRHRLREGRGVDAPLAVQAQALLGLQDPQDGRVEARFGELPLAHRAHQGLDGDVRDRAAAG